MKEISNTIFNVLIVGGGASSFFCTSNLSVNGRVAIIEQSKNILSKVKVSGGGRCNVTNDVSEPEDLIKNYPRGRKELLGPFFKFNCTNTFSWFEERGLKLKTEEDGRVFPVSNDSQDVIDILTRETLKNKIQIIKETKVIGLDYKNDIWHIYTNRETFLCKNIVLGTGSSKVIWEKLKELNVSIVESVPSLFTFKIKEHTLKSLSGISVENAEVKLVGSDICQSGPLLITHEGLSGPAILKSSAFGARILAQMDYQFSIRINWLPQLTEKVIFELIRSIGKKKVSNGFHYLPQRLWLKILETSNVSLEKNWAELRKEEAQSILNNIFHMELQVTGKSTFKEEFVTAGGISLQEINFKNFSLKKYPTIYCIGEMLDIDAVTGGFNFQACWTGGYLAAMDLNLKFQDYN
jgi:predicted Rossmann fold flavoprotein